MKTKKKILAVGTVPKSNSKIVEKDKIDTSKTQIHVHVLVLLTGPL
jgi:hypothetical protein